MYLDKKYPIVITFFLVIFHDFDEWREVEGNEEFEAVNWSIGSDVLGLCCGKLFSRKCCGKWNRY